MFVRKHTIPPPAPGQEIAYVAIDPAAWARNVVQFAGVLLFPGSTRWALLQPKASILAITAASIIVVGLTLVAGLWRRWASSNGDREGERGETRRWLVFAVMGIAGASFPPVLLVHVSEMYAAGMILPMALVIALAAGGFSRMRLAGRMAGGLVMVGAVMWAALAVRSKVADLRRMGNEAGLVLQQIFALLPEDAHDAVIAVCYPPVATTQPKYSVFGYPDEMLIDQPLALWWLRPHRGLRLELRTTQEALARRDEYALIVRWNAAARRMERVDEPISMP